jgi:Ras-related protein Rab-7A
MYDLTNSTSFENILTWKNAFINKGGVLKPDEFPFMVVGNKSDLSSDMRQVSSSNG